MVLFLPIKVPYTIETAALLLPEKEWVISRTADGRLISAVQNNLRGTAESYTITGFDRDDAVQFVLLYEEAPVRWAHDGPSPETKPEPQQDESSDPAVKWEDPIGDDAGSTIPSLKPPVYSGDASGQLFIVGILMIALIAGGSVFVIWRKRR